MWYKPYGSTGKMVSAIGFGAMRFRRVDEEKKLYDYDACGEIVLEAARQGVNYFDTAPFYCDDQSELIIGQALGRLREENLPYYVSTKSSETDGAKLRAQLETSLRRLNVPKINFFHIWCVLTMDDYRSRLVPNGGYAAALQAKAEGLIDHIVISTHCSGAEIETIVQEGLFDGITLGYNILNYQFRQQGLKAAARQGMGVVTMNPLGGGLIPQRREKLDFLRTEQDLTVMEAALRFNACHPEITVVLPGMASIAEVQENTAVGHALGLLAENPATAGQLSAFVEARKTSLSHHGNAALDTLCTGCQYCLPCPRDIPIPKFMLAYNERIFGELKNTMNQLDWHWGLQASQALTCIQCGACEERCTQHLPIISRLEEISDAASTAPTA